VRIPLNRVVAFVGPYISIVAGGVAAWLASKLNVLGLPGLDQQNLATYVAAGLTFALTAGLTWLGHQKWLTGHHIVLAAEAEVQAAAIAAPTSPPVGPPDLAPTIEGEELVSDEEEFASPPPGSAATPDVPD
jgi:hypothetical protein